MKLYEAMELLEEEPTLEFKLVEIYKTWTLKTDYDPRFPKDEALYFMLKCEGEDSMGGAGEFSGNLLMSDDRWEVVRKPVTWQEAIQAWMEGNRVTVEYELFGGIVKHGKPPFGENISVNRDELIQGTWYVED